MEGGMAAGVYCPRCGADRTVTFSTDYACGRCGAVWPITADSASDTSSSARRHPPSASAPSRTTWGSR